MYNFKLKKYSLGYFFIPELNQYIFLRSSYEAIYYRWLLFLQKHGEIKRFEYEPTIPHTNSKYFDFPNKKHGVTRYKPDFMVITKTSITEYHEVKGYHDRQSKTKLKLMKKNYPNIIVKLIMSKNIGYCKRFLGIKDTPTPINKENYLLKTSML